MYFPTQDAFLKLAAQGNLIPVTRRLLADLETPLSAYRKIRGQGESFLFESVEGGEHLGRYSFVGCNPRAVIRQIDNRVEVIESGKVVEQCVVSRERIVSLLEQPCKYQPVSLPADVPSVRFASNVPKEKFLANVRKSKEYITAGDIIQVVGSQRFSTAVKAAPIDIYRAARSINPSPYMFLLELDGFSLVGASPEIHVRCENRRVEIRPIAGTRRRGRTPEEDSALEKELLADPKERAEHVMLVDLARNDIGRVCDFGSVRVKDLMIVERYSHVMHIVSQVEGKLSADKTTFDLMRATFPAGTLAGAPKIRAMQIISELEQTTRGPYGGCVGYFSFEGNLDCCITIRTALIKRGTAYVQAGGGWVNDSEPEAEFQETVNKSKAMLKAVALAEEFSARE